MLKKTMTTLATKSHPSSGATIKKPYVVVDFNGAPMRVVVPYLYEFNFRYKQRHKQAATVRDLYEAQIGENLDERETAYLSQAIAMKLLLINGDVCNDSESPLETGDVLWHAWHRHEDPVLHVPISQIILSETEDFIVCNKPATIPVHPGGNYRLNSLKYIIQMERPDLRLFPVHRLDRLTSGLLVIGKSSTSAGRISQFIQNYKGRQMRKTYVARVRGRFPANAQEATGNTAVFTTEPASNAASGDWMVVKVSVTGCHPRRGIESLSDDTDDSKKCESRFCFLHYDEETDTSLVKCEPRTGRTHQLRIHLQSMRYPIANDPLYGGRQLSAEDVLHRDYQSLEEYHSTCTQIIEKEYIERFLSCEKTQKVRSICVECRDKFEPVRHRGIYLHSCRARLIEDDAVLNDFRAPLPPWAVAVDNDYFWDD